MEKRYINFIFIILILISILVTIYGAYTSKTTNVLEIEKEEIENAITVAIEKVEEKESNEITNVSYEIKKKTEDNRNEGAIGIIIFENGKTIEIYNNPTKEHMSIGIGKLQNNSILNKQGNNILLGHNPGKFSKLENVKVGDIIKIKTKESTKKYKVTEVKILEKDDPTPYKSSNELMLTLITCYASDNSKRIVVTAK